MTLAPTADAPSVAQPVTAQDADDTAAERPPDVQRLVEQTMEEFDIPGLALVIGVP